MPPKNMLKSAYPLDSGTPLICEIGADFRSCSVIGPVTCVKPALLRFEPILCNMQLRDCEPQNAHKLKAHGTRNTLAKSFGSVQFDAAKIG
jgi:hypothetical protein